MYVYVFERQMKTNTFYILKTKTIFFIKEQIGNRRKNRVTQQNACVCV